MRRSAWPFVIGLIALVVIGGMALIPILGGMALGGSTSHSYTSSGGMFSFGDKIGLLEVEGVLGEGPAYGADTIRLREQVERWTQDDSIKGMVIRINSPGGAVSATQDLFDAIEDFKGTGRPVYASMGDVAASGGFYIAMAADEVYANTGTLTGSIGVILSFWGYQDLVDKIGLEARTIKSGEFKDIGSGSRDMTEAEKELLDDMIKNVYEQFYDVVLTSRKDAVRKMLAHEANVKSSAIDEKSVDEYLRGYCDGRIFSGAQAIDYGMIDQIGTLNDALETMMNDLGLDESTPVQPTMQPKPPGLFGKMNQKLDMIENDISPGKVKLEFRFTM